MKRSTVVTAQQLQENLGNSLRELRLDSGLTQSALAEQVGVSLGTISRWERGVKMPSPKHAAELMNIYGITTIEIGAVWEDHPR